MSRAMHEAMIKPARLRAGDRVAVVTLSWGGPGAIPQRYQAGKEQFEKEFGLQVVEMKHALRPPEWVARHPEARAADLMEAFSDSSLKGIFTSTGGDDSVRMMPFVDLEVIRKNPKVLVGYSDTTITHMACLRAGLVTFYGPSMMAGFAENGGMFPYMTRSLRKAIFAAEPMGVIEPNTQGWTTERLE